MWTHSRFDPDNDLRHDILDALDDCDELEKSVGIVVRSGVVTLRPAFETITADEMVTINRVVSAVAGVYAIVLVDSDYMQT